ncbi:hypothetical protein PACG_02437 [Pseudomonas aeruginosa C3719]|nr:hypothetical protein PACG_02437 [Pseudomonas aeruginosa C3719]
MQPRLLLLPFLLSSLPALAVTFQTRLESVEWKVEGDQFECRLSQPVANFGVGEFVRRAGEQATFRLKPEAQWLGRGSATLLAAAPPWRPGQGDINLGQVSIGSGEVPFNSSQQQAGRLLTGQLEGRSPLIRHRTWQGRSPGGCACCRRASPASTASTRPGIAKLLPVNFEQVKLAQVGFPDGGTALNDVARAKLDIILQLLKADPSINRIELDGHSDNSGNRLTNRDLSRRRALAVQEYLKSNGVPESQINVRFYGERYPLVANNSAANRARNRRVTVHLSREAVVEPATEAPKAEDKPAPPAAEPAAPKPPAASLQGKPTV